MSKLANSVSKAIPMITTVPSVRRATLPAPEAIHNGTHPRMNASDVMKSAPTAYPHSFQRRVDQTSSLLELDLREFDDQDRVLRREPDEHNQTDLRVDIERKMAHP